MLRLFTRGVLMAALLAVSSIAWAQPAQTGTISGLVQDTTGGALPGVTVTLQSQDRGFTRSTVGESAPLSARRPPRHAPVDRPVHRPFRPPRDPDRVPAGG